MYDRIIKECNFTVEKKWLDESKDFVINSKLLSVIYFTTRLIRIHSDKTWDIYTMDLYIESLFMLAQLENRKNNLVLGDVGGNADSDRDSEYIKQGNFVLDFLKSGKHLFYM